MEPKDKLILYMNGPLRKSLILAVWKQAFLFL